MKISEKEAVSPVIGVILMVAITVVLAAVLYVWVSSMTPTGGGTPYCTLSASTSNTTSAYGDVRVTWMVSSPSRPDIKWSDIAQTSAKLLDDGVSISIPANVTWPSTFDPTDVYVSGGDVIAVSLLRSTVASGSVVKLVLVHVPSGGTLAESSITVSYTA